MPTSLRPAHEFIVSGAERLSYGEGKSDLLQLLDAERLYQQARLGYARAEAQRYQDTTQLFVAMGGGWWRTADPGHAAQDASDRNRRLARSSP